MTPFLPAAIHRIHPALRCKTEVPLLIAVVFVWSAMVADVTASIWAILVIFGVVTP